MTEWERFQRLAALARRDSAPRVEVAGRVLRTIRAMDAPQTVDLPMLIFSGVSLVAASIGVLLAMQAWSPLSESLSGMFQWTIVLQ
jgi:hypothetical protein